MLPEMAIRMMLFEFVRQKQIDIVLLQETHVIEMRSTGEENGMDRLS